MKGHFKILCNSLAGHSSAQDKSSKRNQPHSKPALTSNVRVCYEHEPLISHTLDYRQKCKHRYLPTSKNSFSYFFSFIENDDIREKTGLCFCRLYIFLAQEKLVAAALISSVSSVKGSSTVVVKCSLALWIKNL